MARAGLVVSAIVGVLGLGAAGAGGWWVVTHREPPPMKVYVDPHPAPPELPDPSLGDAATLARVFEVARDQLEKRPKLKDDLGIPGRRVFVCGYQEKVAPACGVGIGDDLADGVRQATQAIRAAKLDPELLRIKIDISIQEDRVPIGQQIPRYDLMHLPGEQGFLIDNGGERSFILPSEVLEHGIFEDIPAQAMVSRAGLITAFRERNPALGELNEAAEHTVFRAVTWVEAEPGGGEIVRLRRIHRYTPLPTDADTLLQSAVWAADHLLSTVSEQGAIRYHYNVDDGSLEDGYNLLRHAGTTYSILQAYDRARYKPYLEGAQAAIGFLLRKSRVEQRNGPMGGGEVRFIIDKGQTQAKLGGAGLALLALSEHAEVTGDASTYAAERTQIARYLVSQQQKSGEFWSYAAVNPGGTRRDRASAYYPGEAILGLLRAHALDGEQLWLDTARRGADWLIDVRDVGKGPDKLANDHWLMIALSYLYQATEDRKYLDHSLRIAAAVKWRFERNIPRWGPHPDFHGGYYDPPRSTPAAIRTEGLVAVLDTCELAGEDCEGIWELIDANVAHQLNCQYRPELMWWVARPELAFGAFMGGIIDTSIRNDFVQHNLSGMLGVERHRRQRLEGLRLPGGPRWTASPDPGWRGIPPKELSLLQQASRRYLGTTGWTE